jgi:hypothetical protein
VTLSEIEGLPDLLMVLSKLAFSPAKLQTTLAEFWPAFTRPNVGTRKTKSPHPRRNFEMPQGKALLRVLTNSTPGFIWIERGLEAVRRKVRRPPNWPPALCEGSRHLMRPDGFKLCFRAIERDIIVCSPLSSEAAICIHSRPQVVRLAEETVLMDLA